MAPSTLAALGPLAAELAARLRSGSALGAAAAEMLGLTGGDGELVDAGTGVADALAGAGIEDIVRATFEPDVGAELASLAGEGAAVGMPVVAAALPADAACRCGGCCCHCTNIGARTSCRGGCDGCARGWNDRDGVRELWASRQSLNVAACMPARPRTFLLLCNMPMELCHQYAAQQCNWPVGARWNNGSQAALHATHRRSRTMVAR